ncbi:zinc finger protein 277 [Macrobrachium rosenbergii]|uniref:zinc finger protein 277 n=1 Tax=Macrobrachium rosenbergii TaxID=79674 RepID=UPI0034D5D528
MIMDAYGSDFATLDLNFESEDPVTCIFCNDQFNITEDEQPLLQHLLTVHKFVIGEVEEIADLRQYISYWGKLQYVNLKDYCVIFNTNTEPGAKFPSETYYLLCSKLPEDKEIRSTLSKLKLKYVLKMKEKEMQDITFSRKCIYCSETITGGLANCFQHLTFSHGFSVGKPDDIVFGARLLDVMEEKLRKLQCLFCENTFKTHVVMRVHMRKKQHRCLNPKNKLYDRFYLLNYLKPGTPWELAKHDRTLESDIDSLHEEERGQGYGDPLWTDWQEDHVPPTTCLFCDFTTSKVPGGLFNHMIAYHKFDFESVTKGFKFYEQVKVINCIRRFMSECLCLMCPLKFSSRDTLLKHMSEASHCKLPPTSVWDHSQYLIPVLENDGLLYHLEDTEISDSSFSDDGKAIVPEDVVLFNNSVLEDDKLREEITGTNDMDAVAMCLFCPYSAVGEYPHTLIYNHMRVLHCFDFMEVVNGQPFYNQVKLINYIRWRTARSECYYCGKVFDSMISIEEHRALEGHNVLPDSHMFEDARWLQPVFEGDILLQKIREAGDSDEETADNPQACSVDNVFSEDIHVPPSILNDRRLRQELLENMAGHVVQFD